MQVDAREENLKEMSSILPDYNERTPVGGEGERISCYVTRDMTDKAVHRKFAS